MSGVLESPAVELKRVGPYDLLEELPSYGMVQAFVARRQGARELVTLKRLLPSLQGNITAESRFARECAISMRFDHPNLVPALDSGEFEGAAYLVTEMVVGRSLRTVLSALKEKNQRLPLEHFVLVADSVLRGLQYAHEARDLQGQPLEIVHRDLSPRNILVTLTGDVRINDFAVAWARAGDFKTVAGMTVGTAAYLSPEQARGYRVGPPSDLYTFGTVCYEILSGRPVVDADVLLDALRTILDETPEPIRALRPDLSAGLSQVLETAMEKREKDRFSNAEAMRRAIRAAVDLPVEPDADAFGSYLRALLPEEEGRVVGFLDRVREKAASLPVLTSEGVVVPVDLEPDGSQETTVVRTKALVEEDTLQEPSVITMPGAALTATRDVVKVRVLRDPGRGGGGRKKRDPPGRSAVVPIVSLVSLAVAMAGMAIAVTQFGSSRQVSVTEGRSAPRLVPAATPPPEQDLAGEGEPRVPAPPSADRPSGSRRVKSTPAPVRKSSSRASSIRPAAPRDPLIDRLEALRAHPEDVAAFDRLHAAILARASKLAANERAAVLADLDAAERTLDIELLARAVRRVAGGVTVKSPR